MPTPEEVIYELLVRDIDGQVRDLENMRAHAGIAVSAGGVAAAILATSNGGDGIFFWLGAIAFVGLVACTVAVYRPLDMRFSPADDGAVAKYLDGTYETGDRVMGELASNAEKGWSENQDGLDKRWKWQRAAFVALALTVGLFLCHAAFDSQGSNSSESGCRHRGGGECGEQRAPERDQGGTHAEGQAPLVPVAALG